MLCAQVLRVAPNTLLARAAAIDMCVQIGG